MFMPTVGASAVVERVRHGQQLANGIVNGCWLFMMFVRESDANNG
jgi:hypothetical protein